MPESISFGTWLRQQRRALDLTQKALADKVGCAEITVRRMEADEYKPSSELALALFEKLGIPEPERTQWIRFARGLAEYPNNQIASSPPREQKTNLPIPLTSFIGREKDVEHIQHRLAGNRLVTLIGVGGIGKTRLSQQVANQLIDNYANGVWLVEFASLNDPMLVPQSVATVFGIQQRADQSALVETLIHFLHGKTILLILDNCEHLLDACAGLAEKLLTSCPNLKIVVTSREALGIVGEALYQVPSLTIPEVHSISTLEKLNYESIRLFDERAQLVQMDFELTEENAFAITQICYRLDGIPLAIELAAVRIQTLSPVQIAEQLDQCFHILIGGSRTALPKHQTLQACIDWSWYLLDGSEQTVLRRLSVFAGGWTLEAVEAVCEGEGVEAEQLLDLMTQLVNKSLIMVKKVQGQETRFRMLETIRQYARERLHEAWEGDQLRNRHLDFFLQWAERVEPKLRSPQQLEWLDQIETELDNLRAALEWNLTQTEGGEASLRLASSLLAFWYQRAHVSEGRAWLDRALTSSAASDDGVVRAKALHAAGYLARLQGDTLTGQALLEASIDLWRALGPADNTGLAQTLATLAESVRRLGDPAAARSLASEAIELCREQGERWVLAYSLSMLSWAIRDQDDYALARSVITESVALWRALGDLWGLELATQCLCDIATREGDYTVAQSHAAEYLAIARRLGNTEGVALALESLGIAAINLGDRGQAKTYFQESFEMFRELGNKTGQAICLYYFGYLVQFEGDNQTAMTFFKQELALARTTGPLWLGAQALFGLAGAAAATGQALRAARLLGASDARAEAASTYEDVADGIYRGRTVTNAVAQLGEAVFATARADGRGMTFDQAADYALKTEPST
jgi:predicted ATPase/DNA-binding XRE family transcriptional regulator